MAGAKARIDYNLNSDVRAVSAMADALVPYIYENELYGALPGTLPRLTVGGLLMRLNRLDAIPSLLSTEQKAVLAKAHQQLEAMRKEWQVAYEGKLTRELDARLRSLSQAIRDWTSEPRSAPELYPSDIEKRVMVEGLQAEAEAHHNLSESQRVLIGGVDRQIRALTQPTDFIWDARLQPAYPAERYWYLYAAIRS